MPALSKTADHRPVFMTAPGFEEPAGQDVTADNDQWGSSTITPVHIFGQPLGAQFATFSYINNGGTDAFIPGSLETVTASLAPPVGTAHYMCVMTGFYSEFTDGGGNLNDQNFGVLETQIYFQNPTTLACDFKLRDNSGTVPVNMTATGTVLYFARRLT